MVADGLEDDPWVAAPYVEDVRSDAHGVVDRGHLLEQMRKRQQRDGAMLLLRYQVVCRVEGADEIGMRQYDALRLAGRARREDDLGDVAAGRSRPGIHLGLPVGREGVVGFARQLFDVGRRKVIEPRVGRVGGVAAGAEDQTTGVCPGHDPLYRAGRHTEVQRDEGHARPHRAEVQRRHGRARRRPDQQPVACVETERPEPPGDDPAVPVQFEVGPLLGRAVVAPHAEGEAVAVAALALVDDVEQAVQSIHGCIVSAPRHRACAVRTSFVSARRLSVARSGSAVRAGAPRSARRIARTRSRCPTGSVTGLRSGRLVRRHRDRELHGGRVPPSSNAQMKALGGVPMFGRWYVVAEDGSFVQLESHTSGG